MNDDLLATTIFDLLGRRNPTASICPSEVARALAPDAWRDLMPEVRKVAATLAAEGELRITQGERDIAPADIVEGRVRGPIRLRRP